MDDYFEGSNRRENQVLYLDRRHVDSSLESVLLAILMGRGRCSAVLVIWLKDSGGVWDDHSKGGMDTNGED